MKSECKKLNHVFHMVQTIANSLGLENKKKDTMNDVELDENFEILDDWDYNGGATNSIKLNGKCLSCIMEKVNKGRFESTLEKTVQHNRLEVS